MLNRKLFTEEQIVRVKEYQLGTEPADVCRGSTGFRFTIGRASSAVWPGLKPSNSRRLRPVMRYRIRSPDDSRLREMLLALAKERSLSRHPTEVAFHLS